jgi:15-cis-phytoene synthase
MNPDLAALVRKADPDRYFCTLLAPAAHRDTLLTLYAFDHELARARQVASQPMLAMIRLQWWREVVEGAERRHEVASPLTAALREGRLDRDLCLRMIEGREIETDETLPDLAAFEAYCRMAHGSTMQAVGKVLGVEDLAALETLGAGVGAVWVMRKRPQWLPEGDLVSVAREWLGVRHPRGAAGLQAVLAKRDLGDLGRPRLVWDQLAVVWRAWVG